MKRKEEKEEKVEIELEHIYDEISESSNKVDKKNVEEKNVKQKKEDLKVKTEERAKKEMVRCEKVEKSKPVRGQVRKDVVQVDKEFLDQVRQIEEFPEGSSIGMQINYSDYQRDVSQQILQARELAEEIALRRKRMDVMGKMSVGERARYFEKNT